MDHPDAADEDLLVLNSESHLVAVGVRSFS